MFALDVNSLVSINSKGDLISDVDAINNSLYNLLNCPIGTRLMRPDYGTRLSQLIYEPCDAQTAQTIEMSILQSIEQWEPRIQINPRSSRVTTLPGGNGFKIVIDYYIPSSRTSSTFSVNAYR